MERRTEVTHFQSLKFCQIDSPTFKFLEAFPGVSSDKSLYFFFFKAMHKVKNQAKFWEPLVPRLPRNAHRIIRRCENLKPNKTHCSKFGSLGMSQMSHVTFFRPFPKEVNFQWRFICWRSRWKNVITACILMLSAQYSRISNWFLKIHLGTCWSRPHFSRC